MMQIVFFITSTFDDRGGHYYSLLKTASEISKHKEVTIISIGSKKSPVLEQFRGKYIHIDYQNIWTTLLNVIKVARKENASILHAFDAQSFFYARILSSLDKIPIVLTRCGGPNPKRFPYNDEIITYSFENMTYFQGQRKLKHANLSLIANRASTEPQDYNKINKLKNQLNLTSPVILRIARISSAYKKSILQSIKLTQLLNEQGVPVHLVVIGYIQDQKVFDELVECQTDKIHFVTDREFTINASSLIDVADIVVGTGRGFMEAALLGKKMLAPTINTDIPVLVNQENILDIFNVNFSPRFFEERLEEDILAEILNVFKLNKSEKNIVDFAKENFSSENIYRKHLPIYERAIPAKNKPIELLYQILVIVRLRKKIRDMFSKET